MTNALAVKNTSSLMPALTMDEAAQRYNMVVEYTKKLMTDGKDYGVIPGTGKKPTLLKPGAEKLCSLFGLVPVFEVLDKITDFDKGMFYFQYLCKLEKNGSIVGTGIGSCNSKEKKYRYRYVMEWEASESDKENAVEIISVKGRNGRNYNKYKMENSEPFELVNTIDKMAQKRALVAATLIATNASEFFTQDIEDMDFVEGTYSDVEAEQPKRKPAPKPEQVDDAIKDAGPEAVDEPMTIERAAKITDSKGTPYIEIDSDTLSKKTIGISKGLNKPDLTEDKRKFYQKKLDAIKVILQAREDGSI